MEHIYLVKSAEELLNYQRFAEEIQPCLDEYICFLKTRYRAVDLPGVVVWTSKETATKRISNIPIPAYTNDFRVVMTPRIEDWREIYLKQLENLHDTEHTAEIFDYYDQKLNRHHIMQILGHELAHHSQLFLEDDYDSGIWFEEGMAEFISRRYFLSEEEFNKEAEINRKLADLMKEKYGNRSLEEFGQKTYQNDYASIFFEYWRSFLTVYDLIGRYDGNVDSVFASYHDWDKAGKKQTLSEWFRI